MRVLAICAFSGVMELQIQFDDVRFLPSELVCTQHLLDIVVEPR